MKACMSRSTFKILKSIARVAVIIVLAGFISSCDRLFVDDLTGKKVEIISPENGFKTGNYAILFLWNSLKDSESYTLQVVKGEDFNMGILVYDTTVTLTGFDGVLSPGNYYWRVVANNYYSNAYSDTFNVIIDSSGSTANYIPNLQTPSGIYLNKEQVEFSWSSHATPDMYNFELRKGLWVSGEIDTSFSSLELTVTLSLVEGQYSWGVQSDMTDNTTDFVTRDLLIDLTAPTTPELEAPEDGASFTEDAVTFSWSTEEDSGAPLFDSLIISLTEDFNDTTLVAKLESTTSSSQVTFDENGTYYWRVTTYDKAGNKSANSETRSLVIR